MTFTVLATFKDVVGVTHLPPPSARRPVHADAVPPPGATLTSPAPGPGHAVRFPSTTSTAASLGVGAGRRALPVRGRLTSASTPPSRPTRPWAAPDLASPACGRRDRSSSTCRRTPELRLRAAGLPLPCAGACEAPPFRSTSPRGGRQRPPRRDRLASYLTDRSFVPLVLRRSCVPPRRTPGLWPQQSGRGEASPRDLRARGDSTGRGKGSPRAGESGRRR